MEIMEIGGPNKGVGAPTLPLLLLVCRLVGRKAFLDAVRAVPRFGQWHSDLDTGDVELSKLSVKSEHRRDKFTYPLVSAILVVTSDHLTTC